MLLNKKILLTAVVGVVANLSPASAQTYYQCVKNIETCSNGQYLANGSCKTCPAGYKCTESLKEPCPAGTYSNAGASSCTACANGYYNSSQGQASCLKCTAGVTVVISGDSWGINGSDEYAYNYSEVRVANYGSEFRCELNLRSEASDKSNINCYVDGIFISSMSAYYQDRLITVSCDKQTGRGCASGRYGSTCK